MSGNIILFDIQITCDGEIKMSDPTNTNNKANSTSSRSTYVAIIGVIVSLLAIAGTVFGLVKFSIIDSREFNITALEEKHKNEMDTLVNNYKIQIETLNTTISQYEAKISYLEIENQTLISERDKYYDYLINIPDNIYYFENIISELEKKNLELQSSASASDTLSEGKYYISYDNKKENVAIIDDNTGVVFCINEIDYSGLGHATLTLPDQPSETREVKSGDAIPFSINDKNYQIIITLLSWGTNSYSIIIKEL